MKKLIYNIACAALILAEAAIVCWLWLVAVNARALIGSGKARSLAQGVAIAVRMPVI